MKHLTIGGFAATMLLAAAGCSGSAVPSGPASYLTASNSKVAFIHWRTASNCHLRGTITENGIRGSAPAQTVSKNNEQFTGTMRGKSVTLKVSASYLLQNRCHRTC